MWPGDVREVFEDVFDGEIQADLGPRVASLNEVLYALVLLDELLLETPPDNLNQGGGSKW